MRILKTVLTLIGLAVMLHASAASDNFCLPGTIRILGSTNVSAVDLCSGNDGSQIIRFRNSVTAMPTAFVVIDANDIIVYIGLNGNINFENFPTGTYRVYSFSFLGAIIGDVGENLFQTALGSVCYRLTSNFITVTNEAPAGGDITSNLGVGPLFVCVGDEEPDLLTFSNNSSGTQYAYLITDTNNVILAISLDGQINFEPTGDGIVRVWGISFLGNLIAEVGDDIDQDNLSSACYDLSDDFIRVHKLYPDAGQIFLPDGSVSLLVCNTDVVGAPLVFTSQNAAPNPYVYMLTTESGTILSILPSNTLDFDALAAGAYRVWGVSYTGSLVVGPGDAITLPNLSTDCDDRSDNFISLIKVSVDAGTLTLVDASTQTLLCTGDGQPDALSFNSTYAGTDNLIYLVTDENNVILAFSEEAVIDFEGSGDGAARIWALAYTGSLTAEIGDDADLVELSSQCYDLSDNFIEVERVQASAGTVALSTGATTALVCIGDNRDDLLTFTATGAQSPNYIWVITDEENVIQSVNTSGTLNFEGSGTGVYRVWGLAYSGNLLAQVGDDADEITPSDECFDLSDNFITITRTAVDGGTVNLDNGITQGFACFNDGQPDIFNLEYTTSVDEADYRFLITNAQNNILAILNGSSVDLDLAAPGQCRIWGLSFTGTIIAEVGDNAAEVALSDACYELSANFITINRSEVHGGTVSMPNGATTRYLCPSVGNDLVRFDSTGFSSAGRYLYVITDTNNVILTQAIGDNFDFSNSPGNNFRVWGLAFSGIPIVQTGANAATSILSTECYELSSNFISVVRAQPDGGRVATTAGETHLNLCPGDGSSDVVSFQATNASNSAYAYLITNESNIIQAIVLGSSFDFEPTGQGISRVWGLAYSGNLTAIVGANAATATLSDDCYDLSSDFITVVKGFLSAGDVAVLGGAAVAYTCPDDSNADEITFVNTNAEGLGEYVYLITDTANVITAIVTGNSFDFEGLGAGISRVWGLLYQGDLLAQVGDDAAAATLASSCFGLSNNFVTVFRFRPQADLISTADGSTEVTVCSGDGEPDIFNFVVSQASQAGLVYLVVEDGFLVGVIDDPGFNFEGTAEGDWQIYGLSYTGQLLAFPGDNIFEVQLASDCYDLTENFVQLNKDRIDGGQVLEAVSSSAADIYVCSGDGQPNVTSFVNSSLSTTANYVYLLTTQGNIILATSTTGTFDFEATTFPRLRVWGLSYTGNLSAPIGANAATATLSDGCFDLSNNFIAVFRGQANGGSISLPGGVTELHLCVANDNALVNVSTTSTSIVGYVYVISDTSNVVVGISEDAPVDFTDYAPGEYRIWGLSYTGTLLVAPGDMANEGQPASSCFQWSSNFVSVSRSEALEGGNLSTQFGTERIYICPNDGNPDPVVINTTSTDIPYRFVFTDDDGRVLVSNLVGNILDLSSIAEGVYRIYGISYTGSFQVNINTVIGQSILSSDCWATSRNYIEVVAQVPDGGEVSTVDGEQTVVAIVGDGEPDVVSMVNTGGDLAPYAYVVTDASNNILFISNDSNIDFETTGVGICRIWGLSYTGTLTAEPGDNAATTALTDDCYDLSDNFVTVIRTTGNVVSPLQGDEQALANEPLSIQLWPNPAVDLVQLQLRTPAQAGTSHTQIAVYNLAGQRVFSQSLYLSEGETRLEIPVAAYQPGVYLLRLQQGDSLQTLRFVKR